MENENKQEDMLKHLASENTCLYTMVKVEKELGVTREAKIRELEKELDIKEGKLEQYQIALKDAARASLHQQQLYEEAKSRCLDLKFHLSTLLVAFLTSFLLNIGFGTTLYFKG